MAKGNQPKTKPFGPPPGQAGTPGEPQAGVENGNVGLTKKELQELMDARIAEAVNQGAELGFRRAQSYVDKKNQAVKEAVASVEKQVAALRAQGVEITPEQESVLKAQAQAEAQGAEDQDPNSPTGPTLDPAQTLDQGLGGEEQDHPAIVKGRQLLDKAGIEDIDENDPEWELINWDSPEDYLLTLPKAIEAYQKRTGKPPESGLAGIGGGAAAAGLADNVDPIERLSNYFTNKPIG